MHEPPFVKSLMNLSFYYCRYVRLWMCMCVLIQGYVYLQSCLFTSFRKLESVNDVCEYLALFSVEWFVRWGSSLSRENGRESAAKFIYFRVSSSFEIISQTASFQHWGKVIRQRAEASVSYKQSLCVGLCGLLELQFQSAVSLRESCHHIADCFRLFLRTFVPPLFFSAKWADGFRNPDMAGYFGHISAERLLDNVVIGLWQCIASGHWWSGIRAVWNRSARNSGFKINSCNQHVCFYW